MASKLLGLIKKQRAQNKSLVGSIGTAIGQTTLEKLDVRNYLFKEGGILNALFPGVKGYKTGVDTSGKKVLPDSGRQIAVMNEAILMKLQNISSTMSLVSKHTTALPILTKNSMVIPMMARDANITRQGVIKMVKLLGGKQENKADMFFKRASEREKEYESKYNKEAKKGFANDAGRGSAKDATKEKGAGLLTGILGGIGKSISGVGRGIGIAGMLGGLGLGIGGFLAGIGGGVWALDKLGGPEKLKGTLVALADGLNAFNIQSLVALGAVAAVGGAAASIGKGTAASVGAFGMLTGFGAGLGGFVAGLSAGIGAADFFGGKHEAMSSWLSALSDGLGSFNTQALIALGGVAGLGAIAGGALGSMGMKGGKIGLGAIIGMGGTLASVGGGLGLFVAALSGGIALANKALDSPEQLSAWLKALAEGMGAFNVDQLKTFGAIAAVGGVAGSLAGLGGGTGALATLGIILGAGGMLASVGAGLGLFVAALGLGTGAAGLISSPEALKNWLSSFSEGLSTLSQVDAGGLAKIAGALSLLGPAMVVFFGSQGISGIVKSIGDTFTSVLDFITGKKDKKSPFQQMIESLKPFEQLDSAKISQSANSIKNISDAILTYADSIKKLSTLKDEEIQRANQALNLARSATPSIPPSALVETPAEMQRRSALAGPTPVPLGPSPKATPTPAPSTGDLKEKIAAGESGGRYDTIYGKAGGAMINGKLVTENTIDEVIQWQKKMRPLNRNAAGKYQFMDIEPLAKGAGLSGSDLFNAENQERMYAFYRQGNQKILAKLGINITDTTEALAHSVGAGGTKKLIEASMSGQGNKNALEVLGLTGKAAETNPHLNKPVDQVIADAARRVGQTDIQTALTKPSTMTAQLDRGLGINATSTQIADARATAQPVVINQNTINGGGAVQQTPQVPDIISVADADFTTLLMRRSAEGALG